MSYWLWWLRYWKYTLLGWKMFDGSPATAEFLIPLVISKVFFVLGIITGILLPVIGTPTLTRALVCLLILWLGRQLEESWFLDVSESTATALHFLCALLPVLVVRYFVI